jgi:8-oxo-dGTP diphosphatase
MDDDPVTIGEGDAANERKQAERFRAVVAVHLLLLRGEAVLLLRRANTGYEDGNYSVVAGHLEGNETASQAMVREAHEEAGILVAPAELRFVHIMHRKEVAEADERIDLFFAATQWQGEPEIREPEKCSELRWAVLDALPSNVVPYVRAALEHYRHNCVYAEFWPGADGRAPGTEGTISVVALGPQDWRDLRAIRLEALRSEPTAFSSSYEETLARPDDDWQRRLANTQSLHLVAQTQGVPIGMVGAYLGSDDGDHSVAVMFGMYVTQAHRRRGVGRLLVRSLIDRVAAHPGITTIRLWVSEAQHPARRLYEALGFRVVGPSDDPHDDELIMELRVRQMVFGD